MFKMLYSLSVHFMELEVARVQLMKKGFAVYEEGKY
jgi:hypothetical protein